MNKEKIPGLALTPAMQTVATDFDFPTSLAFDSAGVLHVAESGLPLDGAAPGGRIWRLPPNGRRECLAEGLRAPVTGLVYHREVFYVSEGGNPGRITRLFAGGGRETILDGLPGFGNYHTNTVAIGPDEKIYFGQGAHTNSGIIGADSLHLAWLGRLPHDPDIPGFNVRLTGWNAQTSDPQEKDGAGKIVTGAFAPYGQPTSPGRCMQGRLPCTAAIMRANLDGSDLELVAWGIRNAFGLGFLPDGRLLATDQGMDQRGSRPVCKVPELLFEIKKGSWYGWPDFIGGEPVTDPRFRVPGSPPLSFLLANHEQLPPPERPLAYFPANSAATKFAVAPAAEGSPLWLIVALFGDEKPMTAESGPRVGRSLARVDTTDWSVKIFAEGCFARPIDVRFSPADGRLYVLDFGEFEMGPQGKVMARRGSGKVCVMSGNWIA
ncbi:MAG TPA: sugar dehydrogenase [Candidatus Angelobacter sp.]